MRNPYNLSLPAVISFSGGRTSAYMLRKILDAHGGQPDTLKVCFQNTGLEHPATYEFVRDCAKRWAVDVTWLEYCTDDDNRHAFRVVNFESASRDGEPFDALIAKKGYLPNPVSRICTTNLKMRTMDRYLKTLPGFADGYTNAIGFRVDEPHRVARMKSDNGREVVACPLSAAGVSVADVLAFWEEQPFDLHLPGVGNMAGNCVGCFLKSRPKLEILIDEMPRHFDWWVKAEAKMAGKAGAGSAFRKDRPGYAALMKTASTQGRLPFDAGSDDSMGCFCTD